MSEENSGGSLKNALIGLITIIVTALTGIVAKNFMGEDEAAPAAAVVAPAPIINLNVENNNSVRGGGTGNGTGATPAAAPHPAKTPAPKKDDWAKEEPKW